MQEPLHAAAVELDHAATDAGAAPRAKADEAKKQAEERVGGGPEDGEDSDKGSGDHGLLDLGLAVNFVRPGYIAIVINVR